VSILPDINTSFSEWYNATIYSSGLADQAPVRGCIVVRPYGYSIWENTQGCLDEKFKAMGVQNAAFPMLIPNSFIERELEHIDGFAPEIAVVTHAGGEKLEESFVVRPTSETIIHYMFSRWIKSWRDLPLKINQWCSVIRWEKRPRPFVRTTEIWWQEGHTAHADREEANGQAYEIRKTYEEFFENVLAISVFCGEKTENERFAGAEKTLTIEAIMQDGKALQLATSHVLHSSFSRSFGIKFQDNNKNVSLAHLTSWGLSTRIIGAMVMVHGDQRGLVLPPRISPIQIVIVPIFKVGNKDEVLGAAEIIHKTISLAGFRAHLDSSELTPGNKFHEWDLKGVPIRIDIGKRDIDSKNVCLKLRFDSRKERVGLGVLQSKNLAAKFLNKTINDIQCGMLEKSKRLIKSMTHEDCLRLEQWSKKIKEENGFYIVYWCGSIRNLKVLKKYCSTIRCILEEGDFSSMPCALCVGGECSPNKKIIIAKAY
jgi:prolyl-tRNA synthetase